MELTIGNRGNFDCATLEDCSHLYAEIRDRSGEGVSTFPFGTIKNGNKTYSVSYNARIWDVLSDELMFCPSWEQDDGSWDWDQL